MSDITRAEFNELKNKVNEIFDDQKNIIDYIEDGLLNDGQKLYPTATLREFKEGRMTYYEAVKKIRELLGI